MEDLKQVNEIKTLQQLLELLEPTVNALCESERRFDPKVSEVAFAADILKHFNKHGSLCYGALYPDGQTKFFALVDVNGEIAWWNQLYSHPRFRDLTKPIVLAIRDRLKAQGVKEVFICTRRTTPSYKRWLASMDCYQHEIIYRTEL